MSVGSEEFVKLWQSSKSLDEFCLKTGMKKTSASCRAAYYRKKGILLKKYEGSTLGNEYLNIPKLIKLAMSFVDIEED